MKRINKNWHQKAKQTLVDLLGGECRCCGYKKSLRALEFHHIDPTKKEIRISSTGKWEKLIKEIEKCVLVCSNCHKEIHDDLTKCPKYFAPINTYKAYDKLRKEKETRKCFLCKKEFTCLVSSKQKYCSKQCCNKKRKKADDKEIIKLLSLGLNTRKILKKLGLSDCGKNYHKIKSIKEWQKI